MTLIKRLTACRVLDTSRNGLEKIAAKDETFPKKIKIGNTKQSPVFYDAGEIAAWIESKKAARVQAAANDSTVGGV
jgi:prophage regulatory protein